MNIKQIILEEVNDFEWIEEIPHEIDIHHILDANIRGMAVIDSLSNVGCDWLIIITDDGRVVEADISLHSYGDYSEKERVSVLKFPNLFEYLTYYDDDYVTLDDALEDSFMRVPEDYSTELKGIDKLIKRRFNFVKDVYVS